MAQVHDTPVEINAASYSVTVNVGAGGAGVYYGSSSDPATLASSGTLAAAGSSFSLSGPAWVVSAVKGQSADLQLITASTLPSAGSSSGKGAFDGQGPVASRAESPAFVTQSNGTDTGVNLRLRHLSPLALSRIKLRYGNIADASNQEADGPNQITLRAAIEYPAGTYHPVYFRGQRDVVLDPGAEIDSDWLELVVPIPVNTAFYTRTYVTVTSGGKWPTTVAPYATYSEAGSSGTTQTDLTTSGTISGTAGGLGPLAIIGDRIPSTTPRIFILGDSITVGYKDAVNTIGWIARALEGLSCYQRCAIFGEQASNTAQAGLVRRRLALSRGCNVALVAYGTNDVSAARTLLQMQTDLIAIANGLIALGMSKVYIPTIPPRTTSTDGWVTTANQTVLATEAARVALNTWIRTTPAPFAGVIELADIVETARNSGIWKANYSTDGVHPGQTGYTAIAAGMNLPAILQP